MEIVKTGYEDASNIVTVVAGADSGCHLLMERIPAEVTADRNLLDFGDDISNNSLSFNIVNDYYEDLEWHIEYNCDWISSIEPSEGTLQYGRTASIVVNIDRRRTARGDNETRIYVVSDNSQGSSEVVLKAHNILSKTASVTTGNVSDIGKNTATFNGRITSVGYPSYTERGFVYSASPGPTLENTIKNISVSKTDDYAFSAKADGLELGVRYYVRAYASNPLYVVYGEEKVFMTNDGYYVYDGLYVQTKDAGYGKWDSMTTACESSAVGGYRDWRLPTLSELAYMYQNAAEIGGFVESGYWSNKMETSHKRPGSLYDDWSYTITIYYYSFSSGRESSVSRTASEVQQYPTTNYYLRSFQESSGTVGNEDCSTVR